MRPVHIMLALLVVVLWGVNFVFIDIGLRDWPPMLLAAARFTFVVIPAIVFVRFPRGSFGRILLIGVFMTAGQFALLYTAMSLGLPAGLASIVIQIQAAFTVIVAALALREVPRRRQVLGIVIGVSGLAVIGLSLQAAVPVAAFLIALAAALSWAVGNVIARGVGEGINGVQMTVWSAAVAPIPLVALSTLIDGPAEVAEALMHPTWGVAASVVYTAGLASLVGYVIWNSLLARSVLPARARRRGAVGMGVPRRAAHRRRDHRRDAARPRCGRDDRGDDHSCPQPARPRPQGRQGRHRRVGHFFDRSGSQLPVSRYSTF